MENKSVGKKSEWDLRRPVKVGNGVNPGRERVFPRLRKKWWPGMVCVCIIRVVPESCVCLLLGVNQKILPSQRSREGDLC